MTRGGGRKRPAVPVEQMQLVEESVHLLRLAPARAWSVYLAGAVPYAIGLIWFWLETTRSVYALRNLAWTSAIVALLFLWKQVSEALFLANLRATLTGDEPDAVSGGLGALALRQAAVQPTSLIVLPLALLATFPFAWAVSFYRQFSLAGRDGVPGPFSRAWEAARFAQGPYWVHLSVLSLGALLLYANLLALAIITAQLATSIFGVESLNASPGALLRNTALHFAILVGIYLCVDLLLDAASVLQGFYGRSRSTGEDILAALRRAAAGLAVAGVLFGAGPVRAQEGSTATVALDQAIDRTLQNREFAWRTPLAPGEAPAFLKAISSAFLSIRDALERFIEAIARWLTREDSQFPADAKSRPVWPVQNWLIALSVLAAALLIFLLLGRGRRRPGPKKMEPAAGPASVDVGDETVVATAFPEDEWLRMADELLSQGQLRLALRVLHLACLRSLSERGLISVTRWKTGMEYFDEVRRRSRQAPALAARFRQNLGLFELGWYSQHPVELAMIDAYRQGLEEIRGHAR
jgi:hypothetical protein